MMTGGATAAREADAAVQEVCDQVRSDLEGKVGSNFAEYTAVMVSTQLVAGTNYFVKIHLGNEEYIHVRIYKPLPGQGDCTVHSYQANKAKDDHIGHF